MTTEQHSRLLDRDMEYKLAGLLSARLQAERRRQPKINLCFNLSSTLAEVNPISEIVLTLKWFEGNILCHVKYFVHVKHDNTDKPVTLHQLGSETSYISLVKSFKKYKYLRDQIQKPSDEVKKRRNCPPKELTDYRFIIFTTRDLYKGRLSSKASSSLLFPFEEIFYTGRGEVYSFGERDEEVWCLMDGEDKVIFRKEYLPRLRIFSGQATPCDIVSLLTKSAVDAVGGHLPREQNIVNKLTADLRLWWQRADGHPLSEESLEIHEVLREDIMSSGDQRCFEFNNESCEVLAKILDRHRTIFISVPGIVCQLRCSKLRQILEQHFDYAQRYIILTESSFYEYTQNILETLCTDLGDILILDIDNYSSNIFSFILSVIDNVDKLIVVSSTIIPKVCKFLKEHGRLYHKYEDRWKIEQLSNDLQEKLLRRRLIFQDHEMTLGDLEIAWPTLRKIVGGQILQSLFNGDVVTIGAPLRPEDGEYVPRKLQHRAELRGDVFDHRSENDYFLLSNFPESLLSRLRSPQSFWQEQHLMEVTKTEERRPSLNYSPIARRETMVEKTKWGVWEKESSPGQLAEKIRENVHWLAYEGSTIIWKHTYGNGQVLGRFIDRQCFNCQDNFICTHYDIDDFLKWNNPTVLLSGDSGSGKSIFMTRMANKIKKEKKTHWVILMKINQGEILNKLSNNIKLNDVIDLLTDATKCEFSLKNNVKHFLKDCLEKSGSIAVLVDVVAEMCPEICLKVQRILALLQESRAQFLCVAATTASVTALKCILKCSPLTLQPFSKDDQIRFLFSQWSKGLKENDKSDMKGKIRKLVETIEHVTDYEGRPLCSVPLYSRMLSVAYSGEDCNILLRHCLADVELKINLLNMYRKYVQAAKKSVRLNTKTKNNSVMHSVHENFITKLKHYAAFLCFRDRKLLGGEYSNCTKASRDLNKFEIDFRAGLLTKEYNSRLRFVHHTYKEYFAALWCVDHYQSLPKVVSALYTDRFKRIRFFFDSLLAEGHTLHEAAMRGNPLAVTAELQLGHTVDSCDRGGRRAVHLAASYGHVEVVTLLLDAGAPLLEISSRDSVKNWTPLMYADNDMHLKVCERLLQYGADPRHLCRIPKEFVAGKITYSDIVTGDMVRILDIITHPKSRCPKLCPTVAPVVSDEMWKEAALTGSVHVAEILMNSGVDILNSTYFGMTALHISAFSGNDNFTRLLLQLGADVNAVDNSGETALHKTARCGHESTCELLLKSNANPNSRDHLGRTPLYQSVNNPQNKDVCKLLIGYNADVTAQTSQGTSVLLAAARFGNEEACIYLLKYGANVHMCDKNGTIPLHIAAEIGNEVICKMFLRKGAEVNARDANGRTSLHYAAGCGCEGSIRVCRLLLEFGSDLNARDYLGSTALHTAVKSGNQWASRTLIRYNPDVNSCDVTKRTVLHEAILAKSDDVSLILGLGADVKTADVQGYTALHFAVENGSEDLCRMLISRGADVRSSSVSDGSPLHSAAKSGYLWICRLLIENGADVGCTDARRRTALHYAAKGNHEAVCCLLLQQGADPNVKDVHGRSALAAASREGNETVCRMLLEYGADVQSRDTLGQTSLHLSARHGYEGVCHLLLMYHANVNDRDLNGHTALQLASAFNYKNVCDLLLTHGANTCLKDVDETSALLAASIQGHEEICRLLIDNGADVKTADCHGVTALHAATRYGHENVCRLLLEHNFEINTKDSDFMSPLDYAKNMEIYRLLESRGGKSGGYFNPTEKNDDHFFNKYFRLCCKRQK